MNAQSPDDRPMPAVLQTLVDATTDRVAALYEGGTLEQWQAMGQGFSKRSLASALEANTLAIIAEVKKASPSKGLFRDDFDPAELANSYFEGGAAALSVVTEPEHFQGDVRWVTGIRSLVGLPILRKDFIVDEIQVAESAALGADAILLIARILSADRLADLSASARKNNLEVLFEAHDATDLDKIRAVGARMVGINARNLDDFSVDTGRLHELRGLIPKGAICVAESGLGDPRQIAKLAQAGYRGFLVGESLISSDDPARLIKYLRGGSR